VGGLAGAPVADSADVLKDLRKTFETNAKTGLINAVTSLILAYLLYSEGEVGIYHLCSLLLHVPSGGRLSVHNWGFLLQSRDFLKTIFFAKMTRIEGLGDTLLETNGATLHETPKRQKRSPCHVHSFKNIKTQSAP
jgi:hypothetical protein